MPLFSHKPLSQLVGALAISIACLSSIACFSDDAQAQNSLEVEKDKPLHFLVFGDWGSGTQHQIDVAEALAKYSDANASLPPKFVVSTGDNFYEKGVSSVNDTQWKDKFESMYDVKRLPMPFISVLGNHDWVLDPLAQILYAQRPNTRWQMDGFWFSRRYTRKGDAQPLADFFYIDTNLWTSDLGRLGKKQMEWLTYSLKNSTAHWQIVVGHNPVYSNGEHGRDRDAVRIRELLAPVFKEYGVDAYLAGHDHDLQRIIVPDHPTLFLISGAAGRLRDRSYDDYTNFYASTGGFAALKISDSELSGQFIDAKGHTLDSFRHAPVAPQPPASTQPVAK